MKLSKDTIEILKNFASINDGIVLRPGSIVRTCDASKQVLAEATVSESFDKNIGIFDLNRFLSAMSLHQGESEIAVNDDASTAVLTDTTGRSKLNYRLCDITMVKNAPEKSVNMPEPDVSFTLNQEDMELIVRASSILGTPQIVIKSDGTKIVLGAVDSKNTSTHTNELEVGDGNGKIYSMYFKTENLKMIPGSYDIQISFKGIASFKHTGKNLKYWVATEIGSSGQA